jgi:hypothetical protein
MVYAPDPRLDNMTVNIGLKATGLRPVNNSNIQESILRYFSTAWKLSVLMTS